MHDFNNMKAMAFAPAAVHAAFLGFPASTGLPRRPASTSAYTVVDAVIAPPERVAAAFSEALCYMPYTYQPQDPNAALGGPRLTTAAILARGLSTTPPSPAIVAIWAEEGLSASQLGIGSSGGAARQPRVLVSFNRWSKTDPRQWRTWMNILLQQPDAILWLYGGTSAPCHWRAPQPLDSATERYGGACNETAAPHIHHLWQEAAAAGVHPRRIVFAPKRARAAHLHRHWAADVLLDSRIYGAHTTASDGLYTGLPLVTTLGRDFAARVGTSLLRAMSPEATMGVTHTQREYEDVALLMVRDTALNSALRATSQLFDSCADRP
ncbi:hypothetical protein EON62_05265, partial [archaeon]